MFFIPDYELTESSNKMNSKEIIINYLYNHFTIEVLRDAISDSYDDPEVSFCAALQYVDYFKMPFKKDSKLVKEFSIKHNGLVKEFLTKKIKNEYTRLSSNIKQLIPKLNPIPMDLSTLTSLIATLNAVDLEGEDLVTEIIRILQNQHYLLSMNANRNKGKNADCYFNDGALLKKILDRQHDLNFIEILHLLYIPNEFKNSTNYDIDTIHSHCITDDTRYDKFIPIIRNYSGLKSIVAIGDGKYSLPMGIPVMPNSNVEKYLMCKLFLVKNDDDD